jgi:hypothetical protein
VTELVFALEFHGRGEDLGDGRRRARSTAKSQMLSTLIAGDGVRAKVDELDGDAATLEARVQRFGDGTFVEEGAIVYGRAGRVTFDTIGRGWIGPSPAGAMAGGVLWRITGGDGRFGGASGVIASNFTVSPAGDVVDNHYARIYLP